MVKMCLLSDNCNTCDVFAMGQYILDNGDNGFTKAEMKKELGNKFCEERWRQTISKMAKRNFQAFAYSKEKKKWFGSSY